MTQPTDDEQIEPSGVVVVGPALVVRPGDRLILGLARNLTMEQADRIKTKLCEDLPGLAGVTIITGVTQMAAYRPQGQGDS